MRGEKKRSQEGFSRQRAEKNVGYLRERAVVFLEVGRRLRTEGRFDIAAFNIEQFCQLHLKYRIASKLGDFAKTHSLTDLLLEYGRAYSRREKVTRFIQEQEAVLRDLEQAYIGTRYIPLEYTKGQADLMLQFADALTKLTDVD